MKQKLPEIYRNRALLLRRCLDLGLSASELDRMATPMEGKTEEEKEKIAAELIKKLKD